MIKDLRYLISKRIGVEIECDESGFG